MSEQPSSHQGRPWARAIFFDRMVAEARRQDEKWGIQIHGGHAWVGTLAEEFGEFAAAVNDELTAEAATELVHVATVALRAFEQQLCGDGLLLPAWGQCAQTPAQAKAAVLSACTRCIHTENDCTACALKDDTP